MQNSVPSSKKMIPQWALALFPLVLLVLLVAGFLTLNPLRFFTGAFPPLEELSIQQVRFPADGVIELDVINAGPDPVTIVQVLVDDAYWQFTIEPGNELGRLDEAMIYLAYPWVKDEPLPITLITSTGVTFATEVTVAVSTPQVGGQTLLAYALLGIYVGVVPVVLGMLWFPYMRGLNRRWLNVVLALTVGLLIFLFIDTVLEALEVAEGVPGVFQGVPVVFLGTLFSLGVLLTVGQRRGQNSPLEVSTLIALGIGLHNLGEGLAIGAAFATGAAALGSFLVVGFTLHNITEGVGIAAPLLRGAKTSLLTFLGLAVLAGGPAILGTWIGGLAFSPFLATLFLSLGAGAILQVIWEVGKLLVRESQQNNQGVLSWLNFGGLVVGVLIMYFTAFLVKF